MDLSTKMHQLPSVQSCVFMIYIVLSSKEFQNLNKHQIREFFCAKYCILLFSTGLERGSSNATAEVCSSWPFTHYEFSELYHIFSPLLSHFLFQPEKYCSDKGCLQGNHFTVKPVLLQSLINNQGNSLLFLLLPNTGG